MRRLQVRLVRLLGLWRLRRLLLVLGALPLVLGRAAEKRDREARTACG